MKTQKIHWVLVFDPSPWLKKYVVINVQMWTKANNEFQKDLLNYGILLLLVRR